MQDEPEILGSCGPSYRRFSFREFPPIGAPEGRKFVFVVVIWIGKTVAGAVGMWESRRWRFPRVGGCGGKLDVELGRLITRDESFPPQPPARHFHSALLHRCAPGDRRGVLQFANRASFSFCIR